MLLPVRTNTIVELFKKTDVDTLHAQRVKTSHLESLLEGVKNSTEKLSHSEFEAITRSCNNILNRLNGQGSKVQTKKQGKLFLALIIISSRSCNEKFLKKLDYVKNNLINHLELKIGKIKDTITQSVNSLQSEEHNKRARDIIRTGDYMYFNIRSEITKEMFPPTDAVPTYEEAVWTHLEVHGNELNSLIKDLGIMRRVLEEKDLLSLIKLNESGDPIYTHSQHVLIRMHDKYRLH